MTSSLCVLLDGSSYTTDLTKSTSQSSKLSRTFLFDQELLKSNVYQRGFRSLLKRSIRRKVQQDSTSSTNESLSSWRLSEDQFSKEQAAKSRTIDRFIIRDYVAQRQTSTCLLLNINEDDDEKKWFLAQLKLEDEGGLTPSQIDFYRPLIEQAAFKFALTWARQNSFHEKYKDREFSIFYLCKTCQLKSLDTTDLYLAANAFARLMACPSAKRIVERQLCDLHWAFSYFMKNMQRISKQGYTPSKADIYHLFHSPFYQYNVPFETRLTLKRIQNEIRIVNIRETQLKKLSPLFEQATIIMVIDLSTYDIVLSPLPDGKASDKTTQNKLLICLSLLDNILDPKWLFRGPLIVHLMYHDRLAEKLDKDPFQNYFPGYKGANSVKPVVKYFRKLVFERFQLSDPSSKRITAKFCPVRSSIDSKSLKRLYQIVHVAHVDC